ncbi:MAG: CBS domain-containing protein, partial [Nanoarchaeota archaeon]|nr:CBS domain-containing protein [Nanoarchaeota archaeon]
MAKDASSKIRKILNYYPESIGSIMKTEFIAIPKDYTAEKTIKLLRELKPSADKTYHLYVVDNENHLIGILSIRALLVADPKSKIEEFMKNDVIFAKDNSPKEIAARLMARYDLFVLPVVDKEGILRGIVKADDVLDEYIPERLKRERFLPSKLKGR